MQRLRLPRRAALVALAGLIAGFGLSPAAAQTWPTRSVTLVVPFGPGASNDTFTRAIAQVLSRKFGQPFVVENRPGAGSFIGAASVQKAAPDGYTFLESPNGIVSIKPAMKLDLDPTTDLTTVSVFATSPSALLVSASLPVKTVGEFLDYARKSPQPLFYGYTGTGNSAQLNAELMSSLTGVKFRPVSYKSAADMTNDLIGGRLQMNFNSAASAVSQIQSGQVRLLAYTATNEVKGAPAAPTFAEAGVKGMEVAKLWWAFFAPKGLPADILKKMNDAINEAIKEPEIVELFAKSGVAPAFNSPDASAQIVRQETETLAKIIKDAGLKFE